MFAIYGNGRTSGCIYVPSNSIEKWLKLILNTYHSMYVPSARQGHPCVRPGALRAKGGRGGVRQELR